MKKKLAVALVAALAVTALAGCGGKNDGKNTAPEITGVPDEATAQAGVEFDALKGVKANDKEDGDITSKITVESSALTFTNGKVTPTAPGNYELIYEVKDKGGLIANAYCTLTVTPAVGEEAGLYDFDFENDAPVDAKGWAAAFDETQEAAGTASFKQGAYVLDITNTGNAQDAVSLVKTAELSAAEHTVTFFAKSSVPTYAKIVVKETEGGAVVGQSDVLVLGTESTNLSCSFTLEESKNVDLCLYLGKFEVEGTPSPAACTVMVTKIERAETRGVEIKENLYTEDFSQSAASVSATFWDESEGQVTNNEGTACVEITKARTGGGVWSTHFFVGLGENAIEEGKKYAYSVEVTAQNDQEVEFFLVTNGGESNKIDDGNAGFSYGLRLTAGEKKTLSGTFTASINVADPALRFQVGGKDAGQLNAFTIDNVEFYEAQGDKQTTVVTDTFVAEGAADQPWTTYNEGGGVGAVYTEDGKLVYRIEQFGTADWHNKLVVGYDEQPLELPPFAYITISITVKASANVSCDVHLHEIDGNWDTTRPISGTMNITTTEQTFTFTTAETLFDSGNYELLFQNFKCAESGVTVEISSLTVTQRAFL